MTDEHRINRDRREPDDGEAETFTCDYCGEEYDDRERFERHRDREKREQLRGSDIGNAILDIDRSRRANY